MASHLQQIIMQLAANLSLLYADLPVADRFAAAAADGFRHIEILMPYDQSAQWYAQQLQQHGLQLVLINTPVMSDDYPVGLAAQPGAQELFRKAVAQAALVCQATGCGAVHVLAGKLDARHTRQQQSQVLHENLRWATTHYPELVLHLEALNHADVPDYFYNVPEQVAHELAALDIGQVGMQFDFYHVVKENLVPVEQLDSYIRYVRHVQIAGAPDRHEPDLSKDGLMAGIKRLKSLGYRGYIGLEYRPAGMAHEGLTWIDPLIKQGLAQQ